MQIIDPIKIIKLERARSEPYLPMLSFDVGDVCREILQNSFPNILVPITVIFCPNDSLACIRSSSERADIFIHVLLNGPSTPIQVIRHILAHEIIHILVPPETIDGKQIIHTEAFWCYENRVVVDKSRSWAWIWTNFHNCLREDKKNERLLVKRNWKKHWHADRCSWERCSRIVKGSLY